MLRIRTESAPGNSIRFGFESFAHHTAHCSAATRTREMIRHRFENFKVLLFTLNSTRLRPGEARRGAVCRGVGMRGFCGRRRGVRGRAAIWKEDESNEEENGTVAITKRNKSRRLSSARLGWQRARLAASSSV